jgi:drug/metabolite transporter (DMT)-like permease
MPFAGELSALLTACLWTGSALVFASATRRAGSVQVNITRLVLAALYLPVVVLMFGLDVRLSSAQIVHLSLSGLVGLTLGDTFLFKAFQEIGARLSMLVMSLAPAIAALLAYGVLGESLSTAAVIGMAVTVTGIALVVLERNGATPEAAASGRGLFLAFLGAVGQGAGLIFAKLAFREGPVNGFVATEVRIVASLVVLLPVAASLGKFRSPLTMYRDDPRAFGLTAVGSVLGPFLGISFSLIAVEYAEVGVAATIMAIVPVLMLPIVHYVGKERVSWRAVVGAVIAVGGVALLFLR